MEVLMLWKLQWFSKADVTKKGGGIRVNAFFRLTDEEAAKTLILEKKRIMYYIYSLRNARSKNAAESKMFLNCQKIKENKKFGVTLATPKPLDTFNQACPSISCIFGLRSFRKNYWPEEVRLWQRSAKGNPFFFSFLIKDWDHVYGRENAPLLKSLRSSGASDDRTGRRSFYIQTAFFFLNRY